MEYIKGNPREQIIPIELLNAHDFSGLGAYNIANKFLKAKSGKPAKGGHSAEALDNK